MRSRTQIIVGVVVAGVIWFTLGWVVSGLMEMPGIDRVTFLLCLGVVFVVGATLAAAWLEPGSREDDSSSEPEDSATHRE